VPGVAFPEVARGYTSQGVFVNVRKISRLKASTVT
jgi:hypothetical protein